MLDFYLLSLYDFFFFFFFQAEDGIRDTSVTGVQTCALPIFIPRRTEDDANAGCGAHVVPVQTEWPRQVLLQPLGNACRVTDVCDVIEQDRELIASKTRHEIGRASCRERG